MGQLKDLVKERHPVTIGSVTVMVEGLSAFAIASLLKRFPTARKVFGGMAVDTEALIGLGGEACGAFIAAGLGSANDPDEERLASELVLGDQFSLLEPMWAMTFPDGAGNFLKRLGLGQEAADASEASGSEPGSS